MNSSKIQEFGQNIGAIGPFKAPSGNPGTEIPKSVTNRILKGNFGNSRAEITLTRNPDLEEVKKL